MRLAVAFALVLLLLAQHCAGQATASAHLATADEKQVTVAGEQDDPCHVVDDAERAAEEEDARLRDQLAQLRATEGAARTALEDQLETCRGSLEGQLKRLNAQKSLPAKECLSRPVPQCIDETARAAAVAKAEHCRDSLRQAHELRNSLDQGQVANDALLADLDEQLDQLDAELVDLALKSQAKDRDAQSGDVQLEQIATEAAALAQALEQAEAETAKLEAEVQKHRSTSALAFVNSALVDLAEPYLRPIIGDLDAFASTSTVVSVSGGLAAVFAVGAAAWFRAL
eukprot:m.410712 g.410712  ORF g.410712 m.410712 type:complete len:285 (-) comp56542_c0_seq1:55-909(-)